VKKEKGFEEKRRHLKCGHEKEHKNRVEEGNSLNNDTNGRQNGPLEREDLFDEG
jgi:hypothetical protein